MSSRREGGFAVRVTYISMVTLDTNLGGPGWVNRYTMYIHAAGYTVGYFFFTPPLVFGLQETPWTI